MVTAGILPFRENSHGRTGNRTRDLMISSQRLRPLDHEAGRSEVMLYKGVQCVSERTQGIPKLNSEIRATEYYCTQKLDNLLFPGLINS